MNISHISVSNLPVWHRFGGAIERRIVEIAREQARRGHRVRVYSVGDRTMTREPRQGGLLPEHLVTQLGSTEAH